MAVVTGGASGLGEAVVRRLVHEGMRAVVVDRDRDSAEALRTELAPAVEVAIGDVTDPALTARAVRRAAALGPLRVAVGCAGIATRAPTVAPDGSPHPLDAFRRMIEVNTVAMFDLVRLSAAAMAASEPDRGQRGVIVLTGSVASTDGKRGQAAYAASKAALAGMTLPIARDLARFGIRVLTIAPGTFDTPLLAGATARMRADLAGEVLFPRRLGSPCEFAEFVLVVVRSGYLNAEVIRLDAGMRMAP